ncbi:MAG: NHL domain-containing thioredoxin family protein [Actinomycetota bacterium]|nr:NHL domain-containing thioredoxin family protein [Actinomycetota bacterium]
MASRLRAPELRGRAWLNTGGRDLSLADLRGKVVVLDFWTFCCVNCLHVLDELRALEAKYADVLVVVGVHSPKFVHEADPAALSAAVERYGVEHPVLDDPELATWQQYAVRAWPTLSVVDPAGYVVAQLSGEGHGHALDALIGELVRSHERAGTLHRGQGPFVPATPEPSTLRFPAKAVRLPHGTYLVADAGHHCVTELASDGESLLRRIGSGQRGLVDGSADAARFNEPNGLCLLPDEVARAVGYEVVVADTANHALRGVRLDTGHVTTVAGNGEQWMRGGDTSRLSSPWDVAWFGDRVVIAMAGVHQLWTCDPTSMEVEVLAGTTSEGLVDGDAGQAWLAQTSGLAVDDETLWFVDSETSSLRRLRNGVVHTAVGKGLFEFGHVDGPADEALFQHPLAATVLPDRSVAVADTYNGAVRRFDPATGLVSTLASGLLEPSGLVVDGEHIVAVESNAHRLTRLRLPDEALRVVDASYRTHRPATSVAPGDLTVDVVFEPPPGQKLDDRYGPATHLVVSASPPELLAGGAGPGTELRRTVTVNPDAEAGVLHVSVRAASCDGDDVQFPACHVHQQDWGVPVVVSDSGDRALVLVLAGAPGGGPA